MVDGTPPRVPEPWPASGWIDVRSAVANDHWIEAEGQATLRLLERLVGLGTDPSRMFPIPRSAPLPNGCVA